MLPRCTPLLIVAQLAVVVRGERNGLVSDSADFGINISQDGEPGVLSLVSDKDLAAARQDITKSIAQARAELNESLQDHFASVDEDLRVRTTAIQEAARKLLRSAEAQMSALQLQERRLRLALRHGVHGRCCCHTASRDYCSWVDVKVLYGHAKLCPENEDQDYIDHHKQLAKSSEPIATDDLIDACLASTGWEAHMSGTATVLEGGLPKDLLETLEALTKNSTVAIK
jgi:hypothetical protein